MSHAMMSKTRSASTASLLFKKEIDGISEFLEKNAKQDLELQKEPQLDKTDLMSSSPSTRLKALRRSTSLLVMPSPPSRKRPPEPHSPLKQPGEWMEQALQVLTKLF